MIDLDAVIERAQEAFFQVIASEVPADSGDFSPGDTIAFEQACRRAAETWVTDNTTADGQVRSICARCEKPMRWVVCPTGGWWKYENHGDGGFLEHDATFSLMDLR